MNYLNTVTKVLNITPYGKSGTLFFQSLFDNHPNVLMFPIARLHAGFYHEFWPQNQSLGLSSQIDNFITTYNIFFDLNAAKNWAYNISSLGEARDQHCCVDPAAFRSVLISLLEPYKHVSSREFFLGVHFAYNIVLGKNIHPEKNIIVYNFHDSGVPVTERLLADFPESCFIQTIRNPLSSLASVISSFGSTTEDVMIRNLQSILEGGTPVVERYRNLSRAVKIEHINNYPERTMQEVSKWLEIPWDECLLKSTYCGLKWWDTINKQDHHGFNKNPQKDRSKEVFSVFDIYRLHFLLKNKLDHWQYDYLNYNDVDSEVMRYLLSMPFYFEQFIIGDQERARQATNSFIMSYFERILNDSYPLPLDLI